MVLISKEFLASGAGASHCKVQVEKLSNLKLENTELQVELSRGAESNLKRNAALYLGHDMYENLIGEQEALLAAESDMVIAPQELAELRATHKAVDQVFIRGRE